MPYWWEKLPDERYWCEITDKERTAGQVYAPFQRYKGKLRAAQGYLAKMPKDFVERWPALSVMAERLAGKQEELTALGEVYPGAAAEAVLIAAFRPKRE